MTKSYTITNDLKYISHEFVMANGEVLKDGRINGVKYSTGGYFSYFAFTVFYRKCMPRVKE
jgi:hypothetical protein